MKKFIVRSLLRLFTWVISALSSIYKALRGHLHRTHTEDVSLRMGRRVVPTHSHTQKRTRTFGRKAKKKKHI